MYMQSVRCGIDMELWRVVCECRSSSYRERTARLRREARGPRASAHEEECRDPCRDPTASLGSAKTTGSEVERTIKQQQQ
jgi:hypothetical protein